MFFMFLMFFNVLLNIFLCFLWFLVFFHVVFMFFVLLKFEMFYAFLHAPLDLSFFLVLCFSIFCFLTFSPSMSHVIEYFVVEY